jgi:RND family efflux transporter MFP subunit
MDGRSKRNWRRAVGPLLALATLAACGEQNTYVPPPPPKVTVAPPVTRTVQLYLESTGNTAAVNSADLVARVSGFVNSINYRDGDLVKKGTVLFIIEPEPYRLKVEQAKASEANARATLVKAEADYQRQAALVPSGSASKSALDNALGTRDAAKASLEQTIASTKLSENDLSYTSVTAPFDGIVTARKVSIGAYVGGSGSATVLASIVQTHPIYVNFTISEQDVLRIRAQVRNRGLTPEELRKVPVEFGLQNEEGYPHKGHLDYATPTIDASTGTLTARAIIDNPERVLLPGMFLRVRVPTRRVENALLVSDAALGTDQSGRYLLVVGKDNVVEQRSVQIGAREGAQRVIEKGIGADDRVIVSGLLRAVPGQKVDPQTAAAASGAK